MATKLKTREVTLTLSATSTDTPRIMIVGRGQSHGRKLYAWRYRPDIIERLGKLVSGPTYLAVELALTRWLDELEKSQALEIVRSEDLG